MEIRKETKWLCENARVLEQYSGKWVMFSAGHGIVRKGQSLERLLRKAAATSSDSDKPFVLHVPSKRELLEPRPVVRKR